MWIVRYALNRRYTIAVVALLILIFGIRSAKDMSTDILPDVGIPSVNVLWSYTGLPAEEMAAKITSLSESSIFNNVDDLREVRSETTAGIGLVRIEFQPGVNLERALVQITAVSQTILRFMPPGTSPPVVVRNNVSSTPVLQLALSSDSLTDAQLYDYARVQLRTQIQSIPGIRLTLPYGGAPRQIMVDLDPSALNAYGLSPQDVTNALTRGSPTLPSGSMRVGLREMQITLNSSPRDIEAFLDLPVGNSRDGSVVLLRNVASIRDGAALQTSLARLDGANAVSVMLIKLGNASAVDIVRQVRERLPEIRASAPLGTRIEPIFDQSVFVDNAIGSIRTEAVLVGLLVALVVLLFVGSWRSSLIVLANVPLALLASVTTLELLGYTFNVMTLGGLALAIGILVDNAVVDVENTNRHIAMGKPVRTAILASAREVVFPEFVSTLSICVVMTPILLLTGLSSWVFTPLALAVIFALLASFLLSRTLVPVLCALLLPADIQSHSTPKRLERLLLALHHGLEARLDSLRDAHGRLIRWLTGNGMLLWMSAVLLVGLGAMALLQSGREYFPQVDAGQLRLHVRLPTGIRIEESARRIAEIQEEIRRVIPADELQTAYEQIGIPNPVILAMVETAVTGAFEAEIMLQLRSPHGSTSDYLAEIRRRVAQRFPDVRLFERPPDAMRRTLAGSAMGAVEARVMGRDAVGNMVVAHDIVRRLAQVPGAADVMIRQIPDLPEYQLNIDRVRAAQLGVDTEQAARAVLGLLGNAGSVSPVYWIDRASAMSYVVQVQALPHQLADLETLLNTPVHVDAQGNPILLRSIARVEERNVPASIERAMMAPVISVVANVQGADLGSVHRHLKEIAESLQPSLKPGNRIELGGQAREMESAYAALGGGMLLAVALVFLLLVVNFQSWLYPLVAMSGLPIAMAGAAVSLWLSGTALSVTALMGALMVIGVSTANSVLVVSFARDLIQAGGNAVEAAYEAAAVRLRPVLMTASAMLLGIIPMALGMGEGGEQNAPLGRAVIGGLLFGTGATLLLVPALLAALAQRRIRRTRAAASSAPLAEPPEENR
ncbi:efflux RND transporter permease subunit [Pseudomonas aeruginosa]|uniref:efflux RND transporter permease subunit n=1 Tax=Pseudomonas aeruginosa TaxID=287 RepID=UPI00053ECA10|nr:efflux RND transporter permease subunit [Pseudomonas aeruginosa]EME5141345.1 efflux RND transporter permease subunit [Pseudomonas aeruginosa]HCF3395413.1 efflux RND transporter permease subunit [Pseudomonas aeruginosa]